MKIILSLIFALAVSIYISEPKITFNPFTIEFRQPYIPFAMFFLIVALALFQLQATKNGYKKGVEDMAEVVIKELNK